MKKYFIAILAVAFVAMFAVSAQAEEKYVAGGFEASGHVMAGGGYEHFTKNTPNFNATGTNPGPTDNDGITYAPGSIGKYLGVPPMGYADYFEFFVDEVELDLAKSFGENIRLRADLDFGRLASSGYLSNAGFILEQAYAAANIPIGNGVEFLLGRFNTPIGFEAVDASENDTISKSVLADGLRPTNTTGAKIYYAFSDLVDLHFYVVNNLYGDTTVKKNDVPSLGFRLGFNWGEEGSESTLGVSGLWGAESRVSNKHYTYGGDVDLNWWVTESFAIGAEGLFVYSSKLTSVPNVTATGDNVTVAGGLLNLHYVFSDVWDGTLKAAWAKQFKGSTVAATTSTIVNGMDLMGGGIRVSTGEVTLAGGYAVADGAKLKLEARFDMIRPGANTGISKYYTYGGAVAFAYDF